MKAKTLDEAGRWFAPERLSARQSMTPEGFLLCESVPIARTGTLIYDESELVNDDGPLVQGGSGGLVTIERNADEVFRSETIASFEGKPVTLSHPDDFVGPSNWRELSVGITQNVRRGEGVESDLMLADLLITDASAIEQVRRDDDPHSERLRQVSCGYDAEYEQLAVGRGRQHNIVGNHVALVERGRCGPRCAIGDSEDMRTTDAKPQKRTWMDRVRTAFKAKDEAALEEALEGAKTGDEDEDDKDDNGKTKTGDSATLDSILKALKSMDKRIGDMESEVKKITEDEDEDDDDGKKGETADDILNGEPAASNSEALGNTYTGDAAAMTDLRSRAEILVPGLTFPTRDAKVKTSDHVCSCQRAALDRAMQTEDGKAAVAPFLMGRSLDKLTNDQISTAFIGASELIKSRNNSTGIRSSVSTKDFGRAPASIADINERNRQFWNGTGRN